MGVEIEKKYLIKEIPDLSSCRYKEVEQGYLNVNPVIRVRKSNDKYYMTYKGEGFLEREEYNLPLTKESYEHLVKKSDGRIITKKRYLIPYLEYTIELDIFEGDLSGLVIAEVEFDSVEKANAFMPPEWFAEDVTKKKEYTNSYLSRKTD